MLESPRNPLLLALILHEYEDEIYFVQPQPAVQRVACGVLAKVARLFSVFGPITPASTPGEGGLLESDVTQPTRRKDWVGLICRAAN